MNKEIVIQEICAKLHIDEDRHSLMLFEAGCLYAERYANGNDNTRVSLTRGLYSSVYWAWFSKQYLMFASEFLKTVFVYDKAQVRYKYSMYIAERLMNHYMPVDILMFIVHHQDRNVKTEAL